MEKLRKGQVLTKLEKSNASKYDVATSRGVIDAPIQKVFAVLTDFENYEKFIPRVQESKILRSEGHVIYYKSHLNMPWPISDVFYECKATLYPEKNYYDFELVPGTGKGVKHFSGHWKFESFDGDPEKTLATYMLNYAPEKNYPAWVIRIGSKNTIEKNIIAVRKRIQDLEQRATK